MNENDNHICIVKVEKVGYLTSKLLISKDNITLSFVLILIFSVCMCVNSIECIAWRAFHSIPDSMVSNGVGRSIRGIQLQNKSWDIKMYINNWINEH